MESPTTRPGERAGWRRLSLWCWARKRGPRTGGILRRLTFPKAGESRGIFSAIFSLPAIGHAASLPPGSLPVSPPSASEAWSRRSAQLSTPVAAQQRSPPGPTPFLVLASLAPPLTCGQSAGEISEGHCSTGERPRLFCRRGRCLLCCTNKGLPPPAAPAAAALSLQEKLRALLRPH